MNLWLALVLCTQAPAPVMAFTADPPPADPPQGGVVITEGAKHRPVNDVAYQGLSRDLDALKILVQGLERKLAAGVLNSNCGGACCKCTDTTHATPAPTPTTPASTNQTLTTPAATMPGGQQYQWFRPTNYPGWECYGYLGAYGKIKDVQQWRPIAPPQQLPGSQSWNGGFYQGGGACVMTPYGVLCN